MSEVLVREVLVERWGRWEGGAYSDGWLLVGHVQDGGKSWENVNIMERKAQQGIYIDYSIARQSASTSSEFRAVTA